MKIFAIICNVTSGNPNPLVGVYFNLKGAKTCLAAIKAKHPGWKYAPSNPLRVDCWSKENAWDDHSDWDGYYEIQETEVL